MRQSDVEDDAQKDGSEENPTQERCMHMCAHTRSGNHPK